MSEAGWSDQGAPVGEAKPAGTPKWVWWVVGLAGCGLVVIVGIVVASVLFVPQVVQRLEVARSGRTMADLIEIETALGEYAIANGGAYPDGLEALVTPDFNGHTFLKVTTIPLDVWGRAYLYEAPSPGNPKPRVYTLGRDGLPGGEGEDADMDNFTLREDG